MIGLDLATAQEHRPQPGTPALHAGLHARDRQPHSLGGGDLRHTFQLREFYGLPVVVGKLADHRGDAAVGHLGARIGLLASVPPLVLLQCLLVSPLPRRACTAEAAHEDGDSSDQVDLSEQGFDHRQGPTEATLSCKITVAYRGQCDEAEVRVIAPRPTLLRGEEGLRSKVPNGLKHEGEGHPEQHVDAQGSQDREQADLCVPPEPASDPAYRGQRQGAGL
jgi:hypothetical protein